MTNERIESAIEEHLLTQLERDLTSEEIQALQQKVYTVRKLAQNEG